jgi:hypothetical protein
MTFPYEDYESVFRWQEKPNEAIISQVRISIY